MLITKLSAALALALAAAAAPTLAQPAGQEEIEAAEQPRLEIGDRAPALSVEKWIKGDEITGFEKGRVYVVEFWATWCGPCIASMPHLSHLQEEFKDDGVQIIGVNIWEDYNDETLGMVEKFVTEQGRRMSYTVAYDGPTAAMATQYHKAAGGDGIPFCVVVGKDSNVAWFGHPMWLGEVLEPVTQDEWDAEKGAARLAAGEEMINGVFMKAASGDTKGAMADWAKFEKQYPSTAELATQWVLPVFFAAGEFERAYGIINDLVDDAIENRDANGLNNYAWMIVDPGADIAKKDLDLAMRAATKADEFSGHEDPMIIDTLARVYFLKGDVNKAIELQEKALNLVENPRAKQQFEEVLAEYKEKRGG